MLIYKSSNNTVVKEEVFGVTTSGEVVKKFTLSNTHCKVEVKLVSHGASIQSVKVPDKNGVLKDICLAFDTVKGFEENPLVGAVVGRVANRIAGARYCHEGKEYTLSANEGVNQVHGGQKNFSMVIWKDSVNDGKVTFTHISSDGDQGFPGNMTCHATYALTDDAELIVTLRASCDKVTPVDLASHAYYNLNGEGSGNIHDHVINIYADQYLDINEEKTSQWLTATGKVCSLDGTDLDLRQSTRVGDALNKRPCGFVHNYCLKGPTGRRKAARLCDPNSGITLELFTDQPCVTFYTADYLNVSNAKSEHNYSKHDGIILECSGYQDAVNHKHFPEPFLQPGAEYIHTTWHKFSVQ